MIKAKRETVYERGVKTGVYTRSKTLGVIVFYSVEDLQWCAMFAKSQGLSAFGDTPELALKEFGVLLQGAIDSGLNIEDLTME